MSLRRVSHLSPRNLVIFIGHIPDNSLCQLGKCLRNWQVINQLKAPVMWFDYWRCCWTRDVPLAYAVGDVSLHMDPKERLGSLDIPLIDPEGEWLLPRGSWSRRHEGVCLCLRSAPVTSPYPAGGYFLQKTWPPSSLPSYLKPSPSSSYRKNVTVQNYNSS